MGALASKRPRADARDHGNVGQRGRSPVEIGRSRQRTGPTETAHSASRILSSRRARRSEKLARAIRAPAVLRLTRCFPEIELHARGGSSLQIAEWVARDEIDIGIFNSERPASGALVETLAHAPLFHVARAEGPVPPTITFAEAAAGPLFVHSRQNALGRIVEACARDHDIPLKIYAEVDDFLAVRPMIEKGRAAAIVPRSLLSGGDPARLAVRRVTAPELPLYFHLAASKTKRNSTAVLSLADTIRSEIRRAIQAGEFDGEFAI